MKRMKHLLALLVAMVMALGMMATVSAESTYPITLPNETDYEIYQIFVGDISGKTLSNVKYGRNAELPEGKSIGDAVAASTLEALAGISETASNNTKLDEVKKYVNLSSQPFSTTSVTAAPAGYYLIKNKADAEEPITTYLVKVVGPTTITPKVGTPTVEKKIVEGENRVEVNEAAIGDTITYELTATMPANIADYKEYFLRFNDILSKGLTFNEESVVVTVNGAVATNFFYVGTEDGENGAENIEISIKDLFWTRGVAGDITAQTVVKVTYTATLNEDAVIAGEGNPNTVNLDYYNNPNSSGNGTPGDPPPTPPDNPPTTPPTPEHPTGETPDQNVVTYTTELTITKTDENGKILTGAGFTLEGAFNKVLVTTTTTFEVAEDGTGTYYKLKNGTYTTVAPVTADDATNNEADYESTTTMYKKTTTTTTMSNTDPATAVVGQVAADGTVTFTGLGEGHYTIRETTTPAGYNTVGNIEFDVEFNNGVFTVTNVTAGQTISVNNNKLSTTIVNHSGSTLPETGGMGTRLFYIFGSMMVLCAGVLLITKRRMAAK